MDTKFFKKIIDIIKVEEQRRSSLRADEDPDIAYDRELFEDAPFVNELCLMLLVALRHQVERDLVGLAARADDDGKKITAQQYREKVKQLQEGKQWNWKEIYKRLNIEKKPDFLEALRCLANSYKHGMEPNDELLECLKLNIEAKYAPLPESDLLRKGLAELFGLDKYMSYCDIATWFVDRTSDFLESVQSRTALSPVIVSLNPKDFVG